MNHLQTPHKATKKKLFQEEIHKTIAKCLDEAQERLERKKGLLAFCFYAIKDNELEQEMISLNPQKLLQEIVLVGKNNGFQFNKEELKKIPGIEDVNTGIKGLEKIKNYGRGGLQQFIHWIKQKGEYNPEKPIKSTKEFLDFLLENKKKWIESKSCLSIYVTDKQIKELAHSILSKIVGRIWA
ncbi:MAG: hypothetical protein WBG70_09105 [Spirulinaceae cyanobacterium]